MIIIMMENVVCKCSQALVLVGDGLGVVDTQPFAVEGVDEPVVELCSQLVTNVYKLDSTWEYVLW